MRYLFLALAMIVAGPVAQLVAREAVIRGGRKQLRRAFDLAAARPRLEGIVERLMAVFGPDLPRLPEVVALPGTTASPAPLLRAAVALAGERFGIDPAEVEVRFGRLPEHTTAGRLDYQSESWTATLSDGVVELRPGRHGAEPWRVIVADRYLQDPDAILTIVAHEVAHLALHRAGVSEALEPAGEELTDAAAVWAGFGPFLARTRYRERRWFARKDAHASVTGIGYLHPEAIAYLRQRRAELADAGRVPSAT